MKTPVLISVIIYSINSAKILGIYPLAGHSHYTLGSTLMRALAERGHDITVISCFGEKNPPKNGTYRDIIISGLEYSYFSSKYSVNLFDTAGSNPFFASFMFAYTLPEITLEVLKNKEVQELIHSDQTFDVVIVEQFANDAQKALSTHFGAPLISTSSLGANFWVNPLVGNPSPTSYIPDLMVDYSVPMTFRERLLNSLLYVFNEIIYNLMVYPHQNRAMKKYIPRAPGDISEVLYNSSIVLLNSHPSFTQPVPYVPNMIDIGGFHIKSPKKLPQDLQKFLDSAKNGVIYFSMGSNLQSVHLPIEKRNSILKTFAKLKQKVLWKWEIEELPGKPPNVKIAKWVPQQDILAHPNIKLFITHCGILSTTEAVYNGVPILALPIFGDQKPNANMAVRSGFAVYLDYNELSEKTLTNGINEVLNNNKYKKNVKERSHLFLDRQVHPMDKAIYWVEYVIRHKGAPHLRVAALDLPWYKYFLLDVIALSATVVFSFLFIFCYIIKLVAKKMFLENSKKLKNE